MSRRNQNPNPPSPKEEHEDVNKLVYASQEINSWLRTIESSMWMIASILLGGTAIAAMKVVSSYEYFYNPTNLVISLSMFFLWVFFLCFLKDLSLKSQNFVKKAEDIEKKLKININNYGDDEIDKKTHTLKKDYFGCFYRVIMWPVYPMPLFTTMAVISWSMIFIWGSIILLLLHYCIFLCNFFVC